MRRFEKETPPTGTAELHFLANIHYNILHFPKQKRIKIVALIFAGLQGSEFVQGHLVVLESEEKTLQIHSCSSESH